MKLNYIKTITNIKNGSKELIVRLFKDDYGHKYVTINRGDSKFEIKNVFDLTNYFNN